MLSTLNRFVISRTTFITLCSRKLSKKSNLNNGRYHMNPMATALSFDNLSKAVESEIHKKTIKKPTSKFTVAIEGNIGCGKTTLLNYFSKYRDVEVLSEPVDKWRNLHGHNLLGLMYQDPSRWSFTFQSYIQLTMIDRHYKEQVLPVKMLERSLYSAKYCFVENLHRSGKMKEAEYIVLTEWFLWLLKNVPFFVDLIVYLQTRPQVVYERILARSRPEEMAIPLSYLQQLHELHEEWLIHQHPFKSPAPVLVLDGNNDLKTMYDIFEENSSQILGTREMQTVI